MRWPILLLVKNLLGVVFCSMKCFCNIILIQYLLKFAGGGAIEMELSKYLRDYSRSIAGKEQLMISAMAKALEIIPRQLCDNAGFDATNILNKLRQSHAEGNFIFERHFY